MKVIRELILNVGKSPEIIKFGIPDSKKELEDIYRFRFDNYSQRGYIDPNKFENKLEIDTYDIEKKCTYFFAIFDEKIVGSIRLIQDTILPTEKIFSFNPPEKIRKIPTNRRAELGRFVIIPPNKEKGVYLPRNLILLCILDILVEYGLQNNVEGGYSFIKKNFEKKLNKIKLPIHIIKNYTLHIDKTGNLTNYFLQEDNPVEPCYFLTKEIQNYIRKLFDKKNIFERVGDSKIILRQTLYTRFLRKLKVI